MIIYSTSLITFCGAVTYIKKRDNAKSYLLLKDIFLQNAVASVGVKSKSELIICIKGYIYVPTPWWKTDYFEIRSENMENNRRYFYQLDEEGIRYELVAFIKAITSGMQNNYISIPVSVAIAKVMFDYYEGNNNEIL